MVNRQHFPKTSIDCKMKAIFNQVPSLNYEAGLCG